MVAWRQAILSIYSRTLAANVSSCVWHVMRGQMLAKIEYIIGILAHGALCAGNASNQRGVIEAADIARAVLIDYESKRALCALRGFNLRPNARDSRCRAFRGAIKYMSRCLFFRTECDE